MTGAPFARHQKTLASTQTVELWLHATEAELNSRIPELLESATTANVEPLFVWSGLGMDEVERIDRFLGTILQHHFAAHAKNPTEGIAAAKQVVDTYPLVVLASLVGRAARIASAKQMWQEWPAALQIDPALESTQELTAYIAAKVPEILAGIGLPNSIAADDADDDTAETIAAEELTAAKVLLLHTGVQLSVMPLIFERFEQLAQVAELEQPSANDLVQVLVGVREHLDDIVADCASSRDGELPLALRLLANNAPRQMRKLLQAALGYATATAADPANWEAREELGQLDAGLPPILVTAAREELRLRPIGTPDRRETVGVVATTGRPQLYFDENSQVVGVQLPTPLDPAGRTWRVTYGGTVATADVVGLEDSRPRPVVAIEEAVRDVLVELGDDQHWTVPAVDTDDPILIFGADGQSVTDKVSLHSDAVTVLYPVDATIVDPVTGDEVPVFTDPRPAKWPLWQIAELDLRDVHAVQVRRAGVAGQVRSASPMRRPELTLPYARLDNAVSSHGTPVYAGGPVAQFPPTLSGKDEAWRVILAEFQGYGVFSTESVMVYDLEVPAAGGEVEILTDDDYPWLGEYVVRLVNPRGRSFEKHFAIAEQAELSITYRGGGDGFRIPTEDGLSPAEIRVVSGEKPLEASPALVRLDGEQRSGQVDLSTEEGAWLSLTVTPGVLQFEVPLADETTARRTTTLQTRPRRIDVFGRFVVSAPGELRHAHLAVSSGERDICRVPLSRVGDRATADLGKFAERVSLLNDLRITLDWTRITGRRRLSVPLVEATSRDRVTEIVFNEEDPNIIEAHVTARAADTAMTLWLWPTAAPWMAPVGVELVDGECELPEELAGKGPFAAQVTFGSDEDRHPLWPAEGSDVLRSADDIDTTIVDGSSAVEWAAENWGVLSPDQLAVLWSLLTSQRAGRAQAMAEANPVLAPANLGAILSAHPRVGLASLNSTPIPLDDQPGMLISSGLVLNDYSERIHVPGRRRVPWLGALAALADIAGDASDAAGAAARAEQLEYLRNTGGQALLTVLATGQDATLDSACIDQSSVQITALPQAQADAILAQVFDSHRMVPGPLTDDDARFSAIYEVVRNRAEIVETGIMTRLAVASRELFKVVSRTSPKLRKAVNVRFHKLDGIDADDPSLHWTLVPGTSLLIAVAARALARAKAENPETNVSAVQKLIPLWAQLADAVPTLVMSDLLIADALVTHALHGDLTKPVEVVDETDDTVKVANAAEVVEAVEVEAAADDSDDVKLAEAVLPTVVDEGN